MKGHVLNLSGFKSSVAMTAGDTVNIFVFGDISQWWGFSKDEVTTALRGKAYKNINIYISSPGGDLSEAFNIHDLIKGTRAYVTAYLSGICASAATVISCAADQVLISRACVFMVHKPLWGRVSGNSTELRKAADVLDTYEDIVIDLYAAKTKKDKAMLSDLVMQESWLSPQDALAVGFADEIVDAIEIDWTAPSSGLAKGWESWILDNADADGRFLGNKLYLSSVTNFIEMGYTQYGTANNHKAENKTIMNFFKEIANLLVGKKLIDEANTGAAIEALGDLDLLQVMQQVARDQFAKVSKDDVQNALRSMTDEEKSELMPIASTSQEAGAAAAIEQLRSEVTLLQERMQELEQAAAGILAKRTAPATPTNGAPATIAQPKEHAMLRVNMAQLRVLFNAALSGEMKKDAFQTMTGLSVEQARELLKNT